MPDRGNFRISRCVQDRGHGLMVNDDLELIAETLTGKSAAFGHWSQKYQDRLYNTLVHLTGSAEDARDVVQEAFCPSLHQFGELSADQRILYVAV